MVASRARRAAGVVALALLALLLVAPPPPSYAGGRLATGSEPVAVTVNPESPVQVDVTTLAPRALTRPGEPFQVAGTLTNRGDETVRRVEVRLLVAERPLVTRAALDRNDEEPALGPQRGERVAAFDTELRPGESTVFDVRVLVGDLGLRRLGVYPLAVQARGQVGDEQSRTPVGLATTYLPWFPDGPPAATRIAWLWPLVDQPRRGPREIMLDDELRSSLAFTDEERGRLGRMLASARAGSAGACDPPAAVAPGTVVAPPRDGEPAPDDVEIPGQRPAVPATGCRGEAVPVTYAVDPDLLFTVEAMGSPYLVRDGEEAVRQPPAESAQAWLASLREAVAGTPARDGARGAPPADVLALPFADPDVTALSRTGTGLRDDVEQLSRLGEREVSDILARPPLTDVVWPPPGRLTSAALDAVAGADASAVVLSEEALGARPDASFRTPDTRARVPSRPTGPVTGLVVERRLSELLTVDPSGWQGPRLAEQRWIAETAMIAAQAPSVSRTLLVAPDRRSDVVPSVAAAAMHDSGRLPWLCPVSLASVAAGTDTCPGTPLEGEREPGDWGRIQPPAEDDDRLAPDYLRRVAVARAAADQFTENVLLPGSEEAARTRARLLRARGRAESSAWREQPLEGRRMLGLVLRDLEDLRGRVKLTEPGRVTLTGSTGVVQVNVRNELDQPVTVAVDLNDPSEARLSSGSTGVQEIPPRSVRQIPVRVETRTSGQFVVRARLLDRTGTPFGEPVELIVRSTQYGRVALAVTGVGAAVLLVAAGIRITRRALRRGPGRPAGATAPGAGPNPGDT